MSKKATNAARIAMSLQRHGVKEVFGQSNPFPITLACMNIGIRQIAYRQENAGTYMAHGYAACSNKAGVVLAQNGPAATLVVAGLAECLKASIPVIAIVQEVSQNDMEKNAFQEIDHVKLFEGVSKWVRRIPTQQRIEDYVDMAFIAANSGRPGPTVLLCPTDMIFDPTEYPVNEARQSNHGHMPLDRVGPDPAVIAKAAKLLANAKKPFIYAGGGVISSLAQAELRAIQEECAIPVASSTMGKGCVDEKHPLSMGPIGYYMGMRGASKFMKPMVQEADVVLLVGNRTNQNGTDSWTLLPRGAEYIHIDIDPMEIGRNYETGTRIVGDAKLSLAALLAALKAENLDARKKARPDVEKAIKAAKESHVKEAADVTESNESPIRIERFLAEVNKRLDADHIIAADASISSVWLANYITATDERKFVFPRGIAGLGWGLPMGMGAKAAQPGRKVFCLAGDGGFAHVWSELETCKRENLDVVIAVINNRILGYQKFAEIALSGGHYTNACDLGPVDHVKVAEACGVTGIRIEKAEEIPGAVEKALQLKGVVVLDLMVAHDCVPPIPLMDSLQK